MLTELCDTCRSIDFGRYLNHKILWAISLGTWEFIQSKRQCPFCCLVAHCVAQTPHKAKPSADSTIKLKNEISWKRCVAELHYDGSRSADYTNKLDIKSAAKEGVVDAYRYVVYWSKPERWECELQFLADAKPTKAEQLFFGRSVQPEQLNWPLVKSWMQLCPANHGRSCAKPDDARRRLPRRLRLIDVVGEKVRAFPRHESFEYIALSYVWGEDKMGFPMPTTLKSSITLDEDGRETALLPDRLPQTIRDAMRVTQLLNFRYLWVDSLCIIQDDPKDKDAQIPRMDAIYHSASLTIAATSGEHADCGLPGISIPRDWAQEVKTVNGMKFAMPFPPFGEVYSSRLLFWNTRGWTLQEKILSRRMLLFTDFQVYFKCANAIFAEDVAMETEHISTDFRRRESPFAWVADREPLGQSTWRTVAHVLTLGSLGIKDHDAHIGFLPNYTAIIQEFTRRNLKERSDSLQAVRGILATLEPDATDFPAGLPRAYFHHALLWQPRVGDVAGRCSRSEVQAPTWSWARWQFDRGCRWEHDDLTRTDTGPKFSPQAPRFQVESELQQQALMAESAPRSGFSSLSPGPRQYRPLTPPPSHLRAGSALSSPWDVPSLAQRPKSSHDARPQRGEITRSGFQGPRLSADSLSRWPPILDRNFPSDTKGIWKPAARQDRTPFQFRAARVWIGPDDYVPLKAGAAMFARSDPKISLPRRLQGRVEETGALLELGTAITRLRIGHRRTAESIAARHYDEENHDGDVMDHRDLLNLEGDCVGAVVVPRSIARSGKTFDSIALSWGSGHVHGIDRRYTPSKARDGRVESLPPMTWEVVNVMLVRWDGELAWRVAVGKVVKTAWDRMEQDRRTVYVA